MEKFGMSTHHLHVLAMYTETGSLWAHIDATMSDLTISYDR